MEASKVVRADHVGAAGLHRRHVEGRRDVPRVVPQEDRPPRIVVDRVAVALELRVVRGVEPVRDEFDLANGGVVGKL